jgi:hypothetical protein
MGRALKLNFNIHLGCDESNERIFRFMHSGVSSITSFFYGSKCLFGSSFSRLKDQNYFAHLEFYNIIIDDQTEDYYKSIEFQTYKKIDIDIKKVIDSLKKNNIKCEYSMTTTENI